MSVWYCVPSKLPAAEAEKALALWRQQGYKIALVVDSAREAEEKFRMAEIIISSPDGYRGWPSSVNALAEMVLQSDTSCDWLVTGGDDTHPDPVHAADEIAEMCNWHFGSRQSAVNSGDVDPMGYYPKTHTFGVLQCTGDRWGDDASSRSRWPDAPAMIDRICGSPWIGREFAQRINGGKGPLWREYRHNWADEELQNVAIKYGCFWQRRDLAHYHDHARRKGGKWQEHQAWFDADYTRMKPLFDARKAAGFPGSAPL